jgi:hypothetical protein
MKIIFKEPNANMVEFFANMEYFFCQSTLIPCCSLTLLFIVKRYFAISARNDHVLFCVVRWQVR